MWRDCEEFGLSVAQLVSATPEGVQAIGVENYRYLAPLYDCSNKFLSLVMGTKPGAYSKNSFAGLDGREPDSMSLHKLIDLLRIGRLR